MISGGIMQLVAMGAQDTYLTGDPTEVLKKAAEVREKKKEIKCKNKLLKKNINILENLLMIKYYTKNVNTKLFCFLLIEHNIKPYCKSLKRNIRNLKSVCALY